MTAAMSISSMYKKIGLCTLTYNTRVSLARSDILRVIIIGIIVYPLESLVRILRT